MKEEEEGVGREEGERKKGGGWKLGREGKRMKMMEGNEQTEVTITLAPQYIWEVVEI